ncbi:MAG: hypothetical protein LBU06_03235 [Desulfovibrio sp.]|jgi:hypothetical protein|nr:hypothetical protein [Desulfovibrio sp.]
MEPVIGSARLFTAFENAGRSPGAELRSAFGPGGPPADELVRAFEEALMPPGGVPGAEMPGNAVASGAEPGVRDAAAVPSTETVPGPAECMPAPGGEPLFRVDGKTRPETPGWNSRNTAPAGETGTLQSPLELYRVQYRIGLLRAHIDTALQSSRSLTNSLEAALKQSG